MKFGVPEIRDWVFDLDNTLYPPASAMYDAISLRITAYVARVTGLDRPAAEQLQARYFHDYGATVVGMVKHHDVDPHHFLADVHDVDAACIDPDPELGALIAALPGRKIVFTNGGGGHPRRVLARLGIAQQFAHLFDLEAAGMVPKPQRGAYERLIAACAIAPRHALLIEDTPRNLEPAYELGFITVLVGSIRPGPRPCYIHHTAPDLKSFLRGFPGV